MSLRPVLEPLSKALGGKPVAFAEDCIGDAARKAVAALKNGDIALLENLRYHAAEEKNDPLFARELASLGDLYVNDAFSCAHRAHASTEAIARLLPSAAGRLMEAELDHLSKALENPARPAAPWRIPFSPPRAWKSAPRWLSATWRKRRGKSCSPHVPSIAKSCCRRMWW
jgi:phosphoglycerate kinase